MFTPCGAVSSRGINVIVLGLSGVKIHGGISEPGMGTYPTRVRRDRGVPPSGNSSHAPSLAKGERRGRRGQWGLEPTGMKVICILYCIYQDTLFPYTAITSVLPAALGTVRTLNRKHEHI